MSNIKQLNLGKYWSIIIMLLFIASTLASAMPTNMFQDENTNTKISSLLYSQVAKSNGELIPVIIILENNIQKQSLLQSQTKQEYMTEAKVAAYSSQQNLASVISTEIPLGNAANINQFWAINAISAEVSPDLLQTIAQRSDVVRIEPDLKTYAIGTNEMDSPFSKLSRDSSRALPMVAEKEETNGEKPADLRRDTNYDHTATAWGVDWIEAPHLWARGINGAGINISIIDTGIDANHPDLAGKVIAWKDFVNYAPYKGDKVWYSGKGDNLNNSLSHTFDLSGVSGATLDFYGKYEMEYGYNYTTHEYVYYDVGYINISTDNGSSWDTLETYGGLSDGYEHEILDLTPYAGNSSVIVQFVYSTDSFNNLDGWYIDDIGISEISFFDGAETGVNSWSATGWYIMDDSMSNTPMWYSGKGNNLDNTLTQTFDLSGVTSASLTFTTKYNTELFYDYGHVQVSNDGGSYWYTLATYSGSSPLVNTYLNLNSYAGQPSVTVRFLYHTDYSIVYDGWYLSNISIPEIGFYDVNNPGNWVNNGWSLSGTAYPYDDHGHGTHVAGTVAGTGENGIRTGVAPGANLFGAKVFDQYGRGYSSDTMRAMEWSVENHADVISYSGGSFVADSNYYNRDFNTDGVYNMNIPVFSNIYDDAFKPASILAGAVVYLDERYGRYYSSDSYLNRNLLNITLSDPNGNTVAYNQADWLYSGMMPDYIWFTKHMPTDAPLEDGNWTLGIGVQPDALDSMPFITDRHDMANGNDIEHVNVSINATHLMIDVVTYEPINLEDSGNLAEQSFDMNLATPSSMLSYAVSVNNSTAQVFGHPWTLLGTIPYSISDRRLSITIDRSMIGNISEFDLTVASNAILSGNYISDTVPDYSVAPYPMVLSVNSIYIIPYPSDGSDASSQLVNNIATNLGVVPVIAAGNNGYYGLRTIGSPGSAKEAITVGATDVMIDYIVEFSSRGPVGYGINNTIKPDVIAPGTHITSLGIGNDYKIMSGTSMATPHVSGAAALLLSADNTLTPSQVKQTLMNTSIDLGEQGLDNHYGAGRISAFAAVNATVTLPEPFIQPNSVMELFAGANINDVSHQPSIVDVVGDVPEKYADIRAVVVDGGTTQFLLRIYVNGQPNLSASRFRFAMDTDRNASTGDTSFGDIGSDYMVDNGALYNWNGVNWTYVQNIYWYSSSDHVYSYISYGAINTTYSNISMDVVASSLSSEGTVIDIAPDAGHGSYPRGNIKIDMTAISWNASSGMPGVGENITFNVYRNYPYYNNTIVTNVTDNNGIARANIESELNNVYQSYDVTITDEHGNSVYDYVYTYPVIPAMDSNVDYSSNPFKVFYKSYYATRNSILPVKFTMLAGDGSKPYNGNITLQFGNLFDNSINVSALLTPVNGTVEYELNLSGTNIDDYYSQPIYVLNGTLDNYDYIEYIGSIYFTDNRSVVRLNPDTAGAMAGTTIPYLAETYVQSDSMEDPVSANLTVEIFWLNEVEVKTLSESVSAEIMFKLHTMRDSVIKSGNAKNILTQEEMNEISGALKKDGVNNLGYNITTFNISTNSNGLDEFDIDVPTDAYIGYVYAYQDAYFGDSSLIYVFENVDWLHHPTVPEGTEAQYYYLGVYPQWRDANNITVHVWLDQYDPFIGQWIGGVVGENVRLYSSRGDMAMVTTDSDGYAQINITAPVVDVLNSTYDELMIQVWGITGLVYPDGGAVANYGWGYYPYRSRYNYNYDYNYVNTLLKINNGNLDVTLKFKDWNYTNTTHVPTVLDVWKNYGGINSYRRSSNDLLSAYLNTSTSMWKTSIPLAGYGTYQTSSIYNYLLYPGGGWSYSGSLCSISYTPYDVSADIMYDYPKNTNQPITVSVTDNAGFPVSGVSVYIIEQEHGSIYQEQIGYEDYAISQIPAPISGGGSGGAGAGYSGWYHIDLATTDSNGQATLTLKTPDKDSEIYYRIGGATNDTIIPYAESGHISVSTPSTQPELYPVITMQSTIETGDTVNVNVTVYNSGGVASSASSLQLYRNEALIQTFSIPVIDSYDNYHVSTTWTASPSGTYTFVAVADATNTNNEANENNNNDTKQVTVGQPDLVVFGINVPAIISKNDTVDISATIKNVGVYSAGASRYSVSVDGAVIGIVNVPALAPNGRYTDIVQWIPAASGTYTIQVSADSASEVTESDETNNAGTLDVTVVDKPDLTPAISVPAQTRLSQPTNITFTVHNIGQQQSNNTTLQTIIYGIPQNISVPPINASQSWSYNQSWTPDRAGTYTIVAIIDPFNTVDEIREDNNRTTATTTTRYVDLVTSLNAPSTIPDANPVTIWASVNNNGNMPSEPTNLNIYADGSLIQNISIPAIGAYGGISRSYVWTPQTNGTVILSSVIDPDNLVLESNELNNNITRSVNVRPFILGAWYMSYPRSTYVGNSFWVTTYISSTHPSTVNATINLPAGLTTTNPNQTFAVVNSNYNYVWWLVQADDVGKYNFSITVSAHDKTSTIHSNDTEWRIPGATWAYTPKGPINVIEQTVIVKDMNSTVVNGTSQDNLTYRVFDVNMTDQSTLINLAAGAEGRLLLGLEYLVGYPHGCPEQTMSPTLASLRTKQYYENRGVLAPAKNITFYNNVKNGVARMAPGGPNPQQANGGWAWGTGTPTMFYTLYTTYGMANIMGDVNYSHLVTDAGIDLNKSAVWITGQQQTDGRWRGGGYISGDVAMSGFAMVALGESMPYLNTTMANVSNASLENGTRYLVGKQIVGSGINNGGWNSNGGSSSPDAYSTSLALLGIVKTGNSSYNQQMNNATQWLVENQKLADGSWGMYPGHSSSSYSYSGANSEATSYAILALNATGINATNESIVRGVTYLVGVYQDSGSWGSTRTTQMAIRALTLLQSTEMIDTNVTIVLADVLNNTYYFNQTHSGEHIELNSTQLTRLGAGNHTINISTNGIGRVIVGVESRQIVRKREAFAKVPAIYIDPISETFFLEMSMPENVTTGQTVLINATINNTESNTQNVMVLDIPLPENVTVPTTSPDNITYYLKDGTKTEVQNMYNATENRLYIYPGSDDEVSVGANARETYYFNLTFNKYGDNTVEATVYPMYNPTLMALGNATEYVKGYGNFNISSIDLNETAIVTNVTVDTITKSGSIAGFSVLEKTYSITVEKAGSVPVKTSVNVTPGVDSNYTAIMVEDVSAPTVVFTETEASAQASVVETVGYSTTYNFTVATTGGLTTVAMEIPANHSFEGAKVNGVNVTVVNDSGIIYLTAGLDGDSQVEMTFGMNVMSHTYSMSSGWNMVSLPVTPTDTTVAGVFSGSAQTVYGWTGTAYKLIGAGDDLEPMQGYWVLTNGAATPTVTGTPISSTNHTLVSGWNMAGPVSAGVNVSSLAGVTTVYGWSGSAYVLVTGTKELETTKGYWMLVNTGTEVNL